MAKPPHKLALGLLLNAFDRRDFNWLAQQPEDVRKEFRALTAMRIAATFTTDSDRAAEALWLVNERVNHHLFDLSSRHPDLLFRLLASCGSGRTARREWLTLPPRRSDTNKAIELLRQQHPLANNRDIEVLLSQYTRKSFAEFVADCGMIDKEAKEIMNSYDAIGKRA